MSEMMIQRNWLKIFDEDTLQRNLTVASLYLTAWEILCDEIIVSLRNFFMVINAEGVTLDKEKYKQHVEDLDKSRLYASCLWLQKMDAISQDDIEKIRTFHNHRNNIAHELCRLLTDATANINIDDLKEMRDLTRKIGAWWAVNLDIPSNPDLDDQVIDEKDVIPGQVVILDFIYSVALKSQASSGTH